MQKSALLLLASMALLASSPAVVTKQKKASKTTWRAKPNATSAGKPSRSKSRATKRPSIPAQPPPERYQQIQQALATKGYYQGEASGKWDEQSAEALKRFQADQNLTSDGKLNSLSLIALGLGPKRTVAAAPSKAAPETPAAVAPEPGVRQ